MAVVTLVLIAVAFVLALVHEFQANGRDLLGWAVVALAIALLIPQFN